MRGDAVVGEDDEETGRLRALVDEAERYLAGQRWCGAVRERWLGLGVGGVVDVALLRIDPLEDADEWLWVVVGDVPPLYLDVDELPDAGAALEAYIALRREWVDAVRANEPVDELAPVDVAPTAEHADMLADRLDDLEREILTRYRDGESGVGASDERLTRAATIGADESGASSSS